jgi:uncharacterized protein
MVAEWLQKLLILQDRDSRCDTIQRQLEGIPLEIEREEAAIRQMQAALVQQAAALKQLEVKRLDLEGEIAVAEDRIVKYKTQQMQVKKNEEYAALEHEIKAQQDLISDLEDTELQVLEEIEKGEADLQSARETSRHESQTLEAHIQRLRQNFDSFAGELDQAKAEVAECQQAIEPQVLQQYHYVKSQVKRPPLVVAIEDGRCQGCHLKVSGDVESIARKGNELVRCDSCGRILYFDR